MGLEGIFVVGERKRVVARTVVVYGRDSQRRGGL